MKKIPLTQGKYALVDDEDYEWLSQWKWSTSQECGIFYAKRTVGVGKKMISIKMHRLLMKTPKGMETDHKNHDGLDNRKKNLRIVTTSQNQWNRRVPQNNNTSGFTGVSWHKASGKWRAAIRIGGEKITIGYFTNKRKAGQAYARAARKRGRDLQRHDKRTKRIP